MKNRSVPRLHNSIILRAFNGVYMNQIQETQEAIEKVKRQDIEFEKLKAIMKENNLPIFTKEQSDRALKLIERTLLEFLFQ